jgi:hypothetical protein
MDRRNGLDRLDFDDNQIVDDQISTESQLLASASVPLRLRDSA